MCGQYRLGGEIDIIRAVEQATGLKAAETAYTRGLAEAGAAGYLPFREVPVLYSGPEGPRLEPVYWQLIYSWEEEFRSKYTVFNIRAESLERAHNRSLLRHQRCIFPVSAFTETRKEGGRAAVPKERCEFTLEGQEIIPLGGLYSVWISREDESDRRLSAAIITVEPNRLIGEVHDRMPFIIPRERCGDWLSPGISDAGRLKDMVETYESSAMKRVRVA